MKTARIAALASLLTLTVVQTLDAQVRIATPRGDGPTPMIRAAGSGGGLADDIRSTPLTRAEFQNYIEILGLDDETANIARDMYEGFRTENAEMTAQFRERMQELVKAAQESGDANSLIGELPKISEQRSARSEQLRDTFLEDMKLLLTDEQLDRWPLVEQSRRRSRVQSQLNISGAGVDLVALAKDQLQTVPAPVEEQLSTYASALDRKLLHILDLRTERAGLFDTDLMNDAEAQEEIRKVSEQRRSLSVEIRDLNDRTLRLINSNLSDEQSAELTDAFRTHAFPAVYKTSYAENALRAALAMNLDDGQRAELESLQKSHAAAARTLNEKWERAIRENDESPSNGFFLAGPAGQTVEINIEDDMALDDDPSPLEQARDARYERDAQTLTRLGAILSSEQFAALPAKPKKTNPWDPENLPPGANAVFVTSSVTAGPDGGETVTEVQILTPEDMKNNDDSQ